jgi:cytochrome c peroxidase
MNPAHDYDKVRQEIKDILKREDWDDGSLGPLFVRLAWHASGTYDHKTKTGGSNGATMRFAHEAADVANKGLEHAREFLESIKAKHPWITYADLWTLAGVVSIEAMGGPKVPWRPGRSDKDEKTIKHEEIPPNGRLPDASKDHSHVRDVFYRMGFNDREIVALMGAHSLGRCHTERSGYHGPWTYTPNRFSNQYFKLLTTVNWRKKNWKGPLQFVDEDDEIMMLPADMSILWDPEFAKIAREFATDKDLFYKDFAEAYGKLLELGAPLEGQIHGHQQFQSKL